MRHDPYGIAAHWQAQAAREHLAYPYWIEHEGDRYPFSSSEEARQFCRDTGLSETRIKVNRAAVEPKLINPEGI